MQLSDNLAYVGITDHFEATTDGDGKSIVYIITSFHVVDNGWVIEENNWGRDGTTDDDGKFNLTTWRMKNFISANTRE